MPDRRTLIAGGLAAGGLAAGAAAALAPQLARAAEPLPSEPLWPNGAPGGERVSVVEKVIPRTPGGDPNDTAFVNVTRPILMTRRPARPNGAAVLLIPGGGYQRVAVRRDPGTLDGWFADRGFTVFVMTYRLPQDGWAAGMFAPLQDAQRAMRLIRARAATMGFDAQKVAALGFSAGGHVAAMLATRFADRAYAPADGADSLPCRPDAAGLFYPVISARPEIAHAPSARALVGSTPTEAQLHAASADENVPADAPPTFVACAADDRVVPPANSLRMFASLQAQHIPSELHVFERGGHGMSITAPNGPAGAPALLLAAFLARRGFPA